MGLLDPPALSKAAADAAYAPKTAIPARPALPVPAYISHRGGGAWAPEETDTAYELAVANGADVIDGDVQATAEGILVMMHDTTVDRTTNATGNVSDYTAATIRQLNAANYIPWGTTAKVELLSNLIIKYAQRTAITIEPKDPSQAGKVMDMFDAAGVSGALLLNTKATSVIAAAKARGYKSYFYWDAAATDGPHGDGVGGGGTSIAQAVALGPDYLGFNSQSAINSIVDLLATGLPISSDSVNRRVARDWLVAMGVKVIVTDTLPYLKTSTAIKKKDSWRDGLYGYGLLVGLTGTVSPNSVYILGGGLVFTNGPGYIVPGEMCPITNAATTYNIDADLGYLDDPTGGGTPAIALGFGLPDDSFATLGGTAALPFSGWSAYLRWAGGFTLNKYTNRTDAATVTKGSAFVADPTITAADAYRPVRGTGIPTNCYVGTITAGVGFQLTRDYASQIDVLAVTNATAVQIGGIVTAINASAVTTGQLVAGTLPHLKVMVTATTVTIARTDYATGTLSAGLASGTAVTALPVTAVPAAIPSGQKLYLPTGQIANVSAAVSAGATSIPITSLTPSAAIASGAIVAPAVQATDSANRGGYLCIASQSGLSTARKKVANLTIS